MPLKGSNEAIVEVEEASPIEQAAQREMTSFSSTTPNVITAQTAAKAGRPDDTSSKLLSKWEEDVDANKATYEPN